MGHNVKKKKSADIILYGFEHNTGVGKHISDVPSGMKCACDCIACGTALKARKGEIRQHHFAHVYNNDCMYAAEIAIYKACADIISEIDSFYIPPIYLSLNSMRESIIVKDAQCKLVQEAEHITPDNVTFDCGPGQYPPELIVKSHGKKLRLLFDFDGYYSEDDLIAFAEEGRTDQYSVLLCYFPKIKEEKFFAPEHLKEIWADGRLKRRWIRSPLEDEQREKYHAKAPSPHEQIVKHQINDKRIRQQRRTMENRQADYNSQSPLPLTPASASRTPQQDPSDEELYAEEKRIKESFNPLSTEILLDKFDRRWVICTCCGEVKPADEMADYGGRGTERIRGVCKICSRQRKNNT